MGGVEGGELEGGDGAGVEVEGGDGGEGEVVGVFGVFGGVFGFSRGGCGGRGGGLGGVEDAEVAEFVAGEEEGFGRRGVEGEGVYALGGDFNSCRVVRRGRWIGGSVGS